MKLVVTGLAGHGKDTVCEHLRASYGLSFESSSRILLEEVVYPALNEKYGYLSYEECYKDRANHRAEWFELLKAYNTPDLAKLGRLIFKQYDIYCGLRNIAELEALQIEGLVDYVIWVDASNRLGITEDINSITITKEDADFILDNNTTEENLYCNINALVQKLNGVIL